MQIGKPIQILELFNGELSVKVYSDGVIESLPHNSIRRGGKPDNRRGRILKPKIDKYGYQVVTLSCRGKRRTIGVHRLVAMAFISNPDGKPTVNHINGNYRSMRDAARAIKVSESCVTRHLLGKTPSIKNLHFRRITEGSK